MDNLEEIVLGLIESNQEDTYWDFKQEPHEDSASLLHDIVCLANCHHDGDRYLILGVTDPPKCEIKGLLSEQENRKNQADINDFLSRIDFAGDNRPEIEFQTLRINEKEIDVIIIKNKRLKPYFLTKDYKKKKTIRANYIYTRTGDKNTSVDKSADYNNIKLIWKEQFGLTLEIKDRFKELLLDYQNWEYDFDRKKTAYHKICPEFTIEISESEEGTSMEPFCAFYLDNSGYYGKSFFKHNSTVIFECEYAYCDGCRVLFPVPSFRYIFKDKDNYGFYYYNLEEFDGLFASILLRDSLNFETRSLGFPFIIFKDKISLNEFSNYLKDNFDIIRGMEPKKLLNINDPNEYARMINLETLDKIKRFYEENWK